MSKQPLDLFEDAEQQIKDLIDPEEIVNIDVDELESSSRNEAENLIQIVSRFYCDDELMRSQPKLKSRIDADLESIRINLKMRKADELMHDILLKQIAQTPGNASLYKAATELQKTTAALTTKIEDTVTKLSNLLKGYQQEFNFEQEIVDDTETISSGSIHRGSKEFIEQMNNEDNEEE